MTGLTGVGFAADKPKQAATGGMTRKTTLVRPFRTCGSCCVGHSSSRTPSTEPRTWRHCSAHRDLDADDGPGRTLEEVF